MANSPNKYVADRQTFDKEYLDAIIAKATPRWRGVDADKYVRQIRGHEEED